VGAHLHDARTMADARKPDSTPRVRQIAGPLEGYRLGVTDVPVRVFDLTLDGCLVELSFGTLSGRNIRLQVDLPGEGWTLLQCETLHIAGDNAFAVKFVQMDAEIRGRIWRAIDRQSHRSPGNEAPGINGQANDD
jgi:hypothetical protein